ncbi:uncharacterized protein LOC111807346 isoform X3 [Cucurbita pepo subsp. pepo]|uniref:uncharacterized protein LOC111807346 isoform X3 n=1 Tax=Cucurbita pepo subsp. pepo TaxID=3664 RepID=UPI000C9D9785|nr:uncharacterized protein LOC111807346 isoform X3 [Cucurbita pepo subsp. pepo]
MAAEELRVEEALPWLPSQVLDEACDIKVYMRQHHHKQQPYFLQRQRRHDRPLLSSSDFALSSRQKPAVSAANWTAGGHGMQAIFLDCGRQLGGTGVFLPRGTGGTNYQPNKKPACSMVLVPARVVQALNLDVQALGLQISPRKDPKINQNGRECNSMVKNKKGKDVKCSFVSRNQAHSSQEIFLPKEWTY